MKKNLIIIFLLTFSNLAISLDFFYSNLNPMGPGQVGSSALVLKGDIENGDFVKLIKFLKKNPQPFITDRFMVLASNGGDLEEALKISDFIKNSYPSVFIGTTNGRCVSACFFLTASAPQRLWTEGLLGIHRPYLNFELHKKLSVTEIQKIEKNVFGFARSYLTELEVSTFLIDKMFSTSSSETYYVKRNEFSEYSYFFEQLMIARCQYDVNDLKTIRIKDLRLNNPELFEFHANKIGKSIACGKEFLKEESNKYFLKMKIG